MLIKDQNGVTRYEIWMVEDIDAIQSLFTEQNCKKEEFHYGIREVWLINKPVRYVPKNGFIVYLNPGDYMYEA